MDSNGVSGDFTSPGNINVLVVDGNDECLSCLANLLQNNQYQVTACNLSQAAVVLRGEKKIFQIIMMDVNDMHGFQLLEEALKFNVPIIMMSSEDGIPSDVTRRNVMEGIKKGVCCYLPKPIAEKDVKLLWQHVYRRRMQQQPRQVGVEEKSPVESEICKNRLVASKNKKRIVEKGESSRSDKKSRVNWTPELHRSFLSAVERDKNAGPKKILELMNVPGLTRANVASHLQKHRLNENKEKTAALVNQEKEAEAAGAKWLLIDDDLIPLLTDQSNEFQQFHNQPSSNNHDLIPLLTNQSNGFQQFHNQPSSNNHELVPLLPGQSNKFQQFHNQPSSNNHNLIPFLTDQNSQGLSTELNFNVAAVFPPANIHQCPNPFLLDYQPPPANMHPPNPYSLGNNQSVLNIFGQPPPLYFDPNFHP